MKWKILIFTVFLIASNIVFGQKSMQVKYEIGISTDRYSLVNPQNNVDILNNRHAFIGLTISHLIKHNCHFELGVYDKYYGADLLSTQPDTTNLIIGLNRVQIPLRLIYKKDFFSNHLFVKVLGGTSLMIGHTFNGLAYSPDNNNWSTTGKDPSKMFNVFEFGTGLEYEIFRNFTIGLNYRYFFRIKNIIHYQVTNIRVDNSETNYDLKSKGNFQSITFSIGYKFKNIKEREI